MTAIIHVGDCREVLQALQPDSVHCCVTSPPYFGLRDYGVDGQIGMEQTPAEFVAELVGIFREVHRVLRDDGTLWLNLGDSYAASRGSQPSPTNTRNKTGHVGGARLSEGLKPKDLVGIPWKVAFALQEDGWYLRQDIIWSKPNPMPESVRDRCTKSHEYLFLLSKSPRYYFNAEAIAEPLAESSVVRLAQPTLEQQTGSERVPGKTNGTMKAVGPRFGGSKYGDDGSKESRTKSGEEWTGSKTGMRNKRSVWTVATQPFIDAHFATFPVALIEPCILAGAPIGGVVLDPFGGAGTTGLAAEKLGRDSILIELNPEYADIATRRTQQLGLAFGVANP
jgi:DNA modification methylase